MREYHPMIKGLLEDRSVVIAGSGSGVGRAAALLFATHGAKLILADIMPDWVAETARLVTDQGGQAVTVTCDVAREADVEKAVQLAVSTYGRLDVMYNNVGITGGQAPFIQADQALFDKLVAVNYGGVVNGCKFAVRQFDEQGGGGVIVNTASVAGLIGWGGVVYGGTKGAVVALTRALAIEVAKRGIRVNSVCPGGMITNFINPGEAFAPPSDKVVEQYGKLHPLGRPIDPIDCASAALFLASDLASNITGVNLPVDGGLSAG